MKAEAEKPTSLPQEEVAPPAVAPTPATSTPPVAASSPAAPRDAAAQQKANERLDAAVVNDCFAKLDALVSGYEAIRTPTDEQTASAAGSFARTLNGQCGMKERVEADTRYQAILRRLAPLNARMTALITKKCQALKKELSCFNVCVEGTDIYGMNPCGDKCISRPRNGIGVVWVVEELKADITKLGCK